MRTVCRLLQHAGLVALPLGMVLELSGSIRLGQMLLVMVAGACTFWIGRILEGYAAR